MAYAIENDYKHVPRVFRMQVYYFWLGKEAEEFHKSAKAGG